MATTLPHPHHAGARPRQLNTDPFEIAIETGLTSYGGYETRNLDAYQTFALFPEDVSGFLKESQPAKWRVLEALLRPKTAATALDSLSTELECEGMLNNEGTKATVAVHLSIDTCRA